MRYLPCPFSCSSHTHAHTSVTFVFPNHFFLPFSFVMLWDRFVQIRRRGGGGGGGGGVRIRMASGCDDMVFLGCFALCPKTFLSFFFSLILVLSLIFVYFCCCALCVRVPFPPQPTNAYLIATILTDMEQVVMIEFLTVTIKPD
jgi:hypothetical protein